MVAVISSWGAKRRRAGRNGTTGTRRGPLGFKLIGLPIGLCRCVRLASWIMLAIGAVLVQPLAARAADLVAYTEEWAPYNYSEAGEVKGISTDIFRAMCARANLDCEVRMTPWTRGYEAALESPDTLVFSTVRNAERADKFVWIGPISSGPVQLYALRDGPVKGTRFRDLQTYRIGMVRGDPIEQDLRAKGIRAEQIDETNSNASNLRKLLHGHVDLVPDGPIHMSWELRELGLTLDRVKPIVTVKGESFNYFAVNPRTSPASIEKLKQAFDDLARSGEISRIIERYTIPH